MRFQGNVFAGDRIDCTGAVTEVDPETGLVTLDVAASVGERPVLQGQVVVAR